jgi:serine protease AprX
MSVRRLVVTVLGTTAICAQVLAASSNERPIPANAVPTKIAASNAAHSSYIVRAPKLAAAVAAVQRVGGKVTHKLAIIDAVAAELTSAQSAVLQADHRLTLTPNRSATVAGSNGTVQPYVVEHTGANRLHASGITGRGVTIAFLDTGWWSQHATQTNAAGQNVVLQGYDAIGNTVGVGAPDDHYGHGTHILSIATNSAIAQDGTYIGIAPDAARVVVRAFDRNGAGTYANTIRGIDWILKNAAMYHIRVVNMSFGATPQSFYWDDPLARAVMKLWQAGIVVVTSAGNEGPAAQTIEVPGNVPYVITVGAMTDNYTPTNPAADRLASFSSTGPTYEGFVKPEIVAPGGHVIAVLQGSSTIAKAHSSFLGTNGYLGSSYFYMSGTSMSAAVVSGVVALMLQAQPYLSPDQVKCKLMSSAQPVNGSGNLAYSVFQQGAGQIDAYNAVFNQNTSCANAGLDITADLAGTRHFGGPANLGADGRYYIMNMDGSAWGQPESADGYTWSKGYAWSKGYTWSQGYTWSKGFSWSQGYTWSRGYTWSQSLPWTAGAASSSGLTKSASINSWVDNE